MLLLGNEGKSPLFKVIKSADNSFAGFKEMKSYEEPGCAFKTKVLFLHSNGSDI